MEKKKTTLNLRGKTFGAFGVKGSGKSSLISRILEGFGSNAFYYDTLSEAPPESPFGIYRPTDRHSVAEIEGVLKRVRKMREFHVFIVDEANRFYPSKPHPLPYQAADYNDVCRHENKGFGFIARRPVQLNQDLTELADYLFVFRLTGANDVKYLNNLSEGLGDAVKALEKYHFVLVNPDKSFKTYTPITPSKLWVKHAAELISRA